MRKLDKGTYDARYAVSDELAVGRYGRLWAVLDVTPDGRSIDPDGAYMTGGYPDMASAVSDATDRIARGMYR